jgi:hypothetical protein
VQVALAANPTIDIGEVQLMNSAGVVINPATSDGPAGLLNSYAGIGAMGPYYGITATSSAPVILASFRYTGTRRLKLRGFAAKPIITTPFAANQFITVGIRLVTGYTVEDTGGTDVSAYFGAALTPETPAMTGLSARVAGVPGTPSATGLTAGTRTTSNFIQEDTFMIRANLSYTGDWFMMDVKDPVVLTANMGAEVCAIVSSPDAGLGGVPGSMAVITHFDWTLENT